MKDFAYPGWQDDSNEGPVECSMPWLDVASKGHLRKSKAPKDAQELLGKLLGVLTSGSEGGNTGGLLEQLAAGPRACVRTY